jgi:SAM-dependent methyltransferase
VYLADSGDAATRPRNITVDGKRLFRFMDTIYLDRPCEKLDVKKIQVLNEARRPLLERSDVETVNTRVRCALAAGLRATAARRVLEWGCGYHPMRDLLDGPDYAALDYATLDADPGVVAHTRAHLGGTEVYEADRDLRDIEDHGYDAIVSSFVFHFRLSRLHISTMRRALTPNGIVLANVYRRSPRSRRELAAAFTRAGFRVQRATDGRQLCVDHEFWCLTHADRPDPDRATAALTAAARGT